MQWTNFLDWVVYILAFITVLPIPNNGISELGLSTVNMAYNALFTQSKLTSHSCSVGNTKWARRPSSWRG